MKALELETGLLIVSSDGTKTYRVTRISVQEQEGLIEMTLIDASNALQTTIRCGPDTDFQIAH